MKYLHEHGVRGYVALNILIFDAELPAFERQLRLIAAAGVDAVIVQVIFYLLRSLPHMDYS